MNPVHRAAARTALPVAAALLLAGCGIPTTGVVGSGEPATGLRSTLTLYFGGKSSFVAVQRRTPQQADAEAAVGLLFEGPSDSEQRAGVVSGLPAPQHEPKVRTDGTRVSIELDFDTRPAFVLALKSLGGPDLEQLACTAFSARHAEDPDVQSVEMVLTVAMNGVEEHLNREARKATCARAIPFTETPRP
ncbi:hypothetical protein OG241_24610 [Streptomyces sp. NBC_01390]|uniref:hypothetical protein n=1 Tax=Streptomyces sp. NBC_01390 TaxID=2903850 RepID=UPI003243889D